jgi:integrase
MPTILSPLQAEALLRACESALCRRLLGWMAVCLFAGLRPEGEAPRITWAEVNFRTRELSVMGRKRGAKPRIIKLQPTALEWLNVVKADLMPQPAFFLRHLRRKAVEIANEWLANSYPKEAAIVWDEDITRHSFASYRSPHIPVHELAAEMGNSPAMIYGHYRHPQSKAAAEKFWAIRPT